MSSFNYIISEELSSYILIYFILFYRYKEIKIVESKLQIKDSAETFEHIRITIFTRLS